MRDWRDGIRERKRGQDEKRRRQGGGEKGGVN